MKRIKELMDKPLPFTIDRIEFDSRYNASFEIEGIGTYRFYANMVDYETLNFEYDEMWVVEFALQEEKHGFYNWDISGTGNEIEVFSTMAVIFKGFLKTIDPFNFTFSAKEKSRIKLYTLFAKKIASQYNYIYVTDKGYDNDTAFLFEKDF